MTTNPLLAQFADQVVMVSPDQASRFEACLNAAVEHPRFGELAAIGAHTDFWQEDGGWCRPYVVQNRILQIPIKGVLLNDFPYQLYGWATGYDYILEAFKRGCADYAIGAIKGIALVCDTPGGMVAGCFDAIDKMIALKSETGCPVRAFAHESAYSAGYAIATVADSIAVSRTGGVGSIGVVTSHVDLSGMYQRLGVKVTFIASDPSKVEGNPTESPSAEFLARTQARIDELYSIFVAAVARSRGLSEDAIRNDLKAHCYTATQAVSNGLADSIGSLDDATAAFAAFLDAPSETPEGDEEMSTPDTSTVDQAVIDQAAAAARAEGRAEGERAAQERISAILSSDEAADRRELAEHFAFKTNMDAESAIAALAAAPKATAAPAPTATAPNGFDVAMNQTPNPEVGANQQAPDGGKPKGATKVLALVRASGIGGFTEKKD